MLELTHLYMLCFMGVLLNRVAFVTRKNAPSAQRCVFEGFSLSANPQYSGDLKVTALCGHVLAMFGPVSRYLGFTKWVSWILRRKITSGR